MTDTQPAPPRLAQALLHVLVRPSDVESIPGDLLEEYREVRRPSLGRARADAWYTRHVLSMLWRVMWPGAVAMVALRVLSFPLATGANPSLVPAPGVSLVDALILAWAGFHTSRRTGRIVSGVVVAISISVVSVTAFFVYALITAPSLLLAPFEKPFVFAIVSIVFVLAFGFAVAAGTFGAAMGKWLPERRVDLT